MIMDGPRFVVSLQKVDDPCCFKDFFETEVLKRAKEEGQKAVKKHNRAVLIFDRKDINGIFRIEPDKLPGEEVKQVKPAPIRKTRKKPEKKEVKKSKYFD